MDDLQRELGRLESRLAETTPDSRVIDELGAMGGNLARAAPDDAPLQLRNLRVASPCKERWADMTGEERVRVCNGCDRPVFNLSAMTRAQAEAVLATRGITPCVRFYRRADGTVMTSDCPTGTVRRSRKLTVIAAGTLLGASPAIADTEPDPDTTEEPAPTGEPATPVSQIPTTQIDPCEDTHPGRLIVTMGIPIRHEPRRRPALEWSTWARLGYGIAVQPSNIAARSTTPLLPEQTTLGEGALGIDLTLGIGNRGGIRIGAFAEARTVSGPVLGGELIVGGLRAPAGSGSLGLTLRGGGNGNVITGALGFGYAAADPWVGHRHATGARMMTSWTRSKDDPRDWSFTIGIELDPLTLLGYLVNR